MVSLLICQNVIFLQMFVHCDAVLCDINQIDGICKRPCPYSSPLKTSKGIHTIVETQHLKSLLLQHLMPNASWLFWRHILQVLLLCTTNCNAENIFILLFSLSPTSTKRHRKWSIAENAAVIGKNNALKLLVHFGCLNKVSLKKLFIFCGHLQFWALRLSNIAVTEHGCFWNLIRYFSCMQ